MILACLYRHIHAFFGRQKTRFRIIQYFIHNIITSMTVRLVFIRSHSVRFASVIYFRTTRPPPEPGSLLYWYNIPGGYCTKCAFEKTTRSKISNNNGSKFYTRTRPDAFWIIYIYMYIYIFFFESVTENTLRSPAVELRTASTSFDLIDFFILENASSTESFQYKRCQHQVKKKK